MIRRVKLFWRRAIQEGVFEVLMNWIRGVLVAAVLVGCAGPEAAQAPTRGEARVMELVKKVGGNWDALSAEEKTEMTRDLGKGIEQTAKVSFQARSSAGGPPGMPGQ
jgi:hypothetical protein